MLRTAIAVVLAMAWNTGALVAPGAADEWVVEKSSGDVRINRARNGWTPISTRQDLRPGDTVWTGPSGRVLLRHPRGVIVVAPGSMVQVPERDFGASRTIVFQYKGQASANVGRGASGHFAIHTPYLAAVVKGTNFAVTVGNRATIVSVDHGVVQVRDFDTGETVDLVAGRAVATLNQPNAGLSRQLDSRGASAAGLRAAAESGSVTRSGQGLGTVTDGVTNALNTTTTHTGSSVGGVGSAVGSATSSATSSASSTSSAVGSAVSSVGSAVGGVAGSLGIE